MILFILKPLTFILSTVNISIHAKSIHHVIAPVAVILITIGEYDLSLAILLSIFPAAIVASAIGPCLHAMAIWEIGLWMPLALILGIAFNRFEGFIDSFY